MASKPRHVGRAPGAGRRAACAVAGLAVAVLWCLMPPAAHAGDSDARIAASVPGAKRAAARPAWSELTPAQKEALAPLASQWHTLSEVHRRKWLQIAARYQKLAPAEQERARQRMEEWIRLTPQQRRLARENFQIHRTLPAERKAEAWDRYQQLSEAQKRELAAAEKVAPRPGAVSALPSGRKPATSPTSPVLPSPTSTSPPPAAPEKAASEAAVQPAAGSASDATPALPAAAGDAGASAPLATGSAQLGDTPMPASAVAPEGEVSQ